MKLWLIFKKITKNLAKSFKISYFIPYKYFGIIRGVIFYEIENCHFFYEIENDNSVHV